MSQMDAQTEYLASLTDAELKTAAEAARDHLARAAVAERNSDWHEFCFAACIVYGQEIVRRGIDLRTLN